MKYAEVAVNSPIARQHSFCYSIPPQLSISIGQAVWVPFGSKMLQGIVVKLSDIPSVEVTKDIVSVISSRPLLSPVHVRLAFWLSEYYFAPLFNCVALMLPPGFEQRLVTFLQLLPQSIDLSQFTEDEKQLIRFLEGSDKVKLKEVERIFGKRKAEQITRVLQRQHVITKSEQLEEIRVKPKLTRYLKLEVDSSRLQEQILKLKKERAYRQLEALEFLAAYPDPISFMELKKNIACQWPVIKSLNERGIISIFDTQVRRDPLAHLKIAPTLPLELIPSQETAWQAIRERLVSCLDAGQSSIFLLAGVTGSGKTEVYLRALAEVVSQGKRGICMVPEIALTPQAIERFASRFPGRAAIFHSALSLGEQFDEWYRIQNGDCDVVVGSRSALFVPQPDLALIVIDEEHEWTYKQVDKSPRYHAREAAIRLAQLTGATVILGSATPDISTFYRARQGEYRLLELKDRITPRGISPLPEVEIVDTRNELKAGNRSLFSRSLSGAMSEVLARGEQVILFLNRRGTANFIRCQVCGYVPSCQRCLVPLTYHSATGKLVCHRCNYNSSVPQVCSQCFSPQLKYFGIGTQRVEQETRSLFPQVKILRWDRDITLRRRAHEEILTKFKEHEADVLIGTQMVAKGLDIPKVTLAGVISADTGLNLPDFRAAERTFQLICQVAGRAGRGFTAGKVIVQTYCPEHYAIRAAAGHDYLGFYNHEIKYRHQFGYPPFNQLVRLVFSHTNLYACRREAEKMYQLLDTEKNRKGIVDLRIIGPVPAYISRIRGRYQWQLILCGVALSELLTGISFHQGWIIDVDPVSVI